MSATIFADGSAARSSDATLCPVASGSGDVEDDNVRATRSRNRLRNPSPASAFADGLDVTVPKTTVSDETYRSLFQSVDDAVAICEVVRDPNGHTADYRIIDVNPAFAKHTGRPAAELIGHTAAEAYPEFDPGWMDHYLRAIETGETAHFDRWFPQSRRWYGVSACPLGGDRFAIVLADVTEKKRDIEDAEHLQRASSFFIEGSSAGGVFDVILEAATALCRADFGTMQMLEGDHLRMAAAKNIHPESAAFWANVSVDDETSCAAVLREGKRSIMRDVRDPALHHSAHALRMFALTGIVSVQSTPLRARDGRLVGMISTYWRNVHTPEERELKLIDVLARQAADVFERRRVLETLRDREESLSRLNDELEERVRERTSEIDALFARLVSAQEEERRRVGRDIHDQLGQHMTALRVNLEAVRIKAGDDAALIEQAKRTQQLAEALDQSIDLLTWELRPAVLDHLGLSAGLGHLVSSWSERFGIESDYKAVGIDGTRLSPEVETNLYRLAQEALHNVYKHANATRVSVVLERNNGLLILLLEDDGVGFAEETVDAARPSSFGLLNMRERAALAGGGLTIESSPGNGTTVVARVPLGAASRPIAP